MLSCLVIYYGHFYSDNEKQLLSEHNRRISFNEEINFEQQVQEFLKEHKDDDECYQHHQRQQFDGEQPMIQQSEENIDDLDHNMIGKDDHELTRNDDDLLLEMENCIN